tara:strand:- start:155 stop:355 length:201 start_codon:yes stop_codon:yes gene_type:complete
VKPAFLLVCYLSGAPEGGLHFKNANTCMSFKKVLHGQTIMKNKKEKTYQCFCKLVPEVDSTKIQIY